jgi:peptidoglycan hydrolase CwlO-like protein
LARLRERSKGEAVAPISVARAADGHTDVNGNDIDKAIAKLDGDRERLEARLTALARENKRLKTDLAALETWKSEPGNDARRASAALREQMNELAAEVVNLTVKLDGPDSPIAKALASPPREGGPANVERVTSLADRVRALQKAGSAD